MLLGEEEGLDYEVCVNRIRLEDFSQFKYLGCVLDESGTDEAECSRKVADAIWSPVNARDFQTDCARILHETLFVPVLTYVSETMSRKKKERCRIRDVQMYNLKGLLGIRRMEKFPNARI